MSEPEEFRDEVYAAEGYRTESVHGDQGGNSEAPWAFTGREGNGRDFMGRETIGREPSGRESIARETVTREATFRETGRESRADFGREPIREATGPQPVALGAQGRDLMGRESIGRESMGREPLGREPMGRVAGSPLPTGSPLPVGTGSAQGHEGQARAGTPPGRALSAPSAMDDNSAMQRAMGVLKQALPFVQRLLPLIDGNIATAIGNLFAPRPHTPPPPGVDLTPVQNQISELQEHQMELRAAVQEQTTGVKRVEDQLEMVREATDRNTLEQQELIEDLKAMGNKVNLFAVLLSALLMLSVILNVVLYMHVKRVLP
ncbi:MAG TPA: hypothetical protein VG225_14265 [Terracidiphilus sp.]|jgi:hypothetical protein|nr:hypothetical protein [Terracidiphilus sp.]